MQANRGRTPGAIGAGLLSGALTLAAADAVAGLVAPDATPVIAVGSAFIDLTPGWLKDFAVSTFGTHDKLVLLSGMALTLAALSGLAGLAARRRPAAGVALVGLLGLVALAAAVSRPGAGPLAAVPIVVGVVLGTAVLVRLSRPVPAAAGTPGGPTRRTALLAAGATAVLAATGRALAAAGQGASPADLRLPAPAEAAAPLSGTTVGVTGTTPFVTPNAAFYRIDTALAVPRLDPAAWRLRIHGLVGRELELTFEDLLRLPLVERWITLTCVSNEVGGTLAGNARWLGLPVRDLLARVTPGRDADMVLSRSSDGFTASTPLEALTDPARDALVAVGMNGAPLPREHGFPARLVVPGLYGYVSATKWLTELEVTRFDRARAYWTERGWSPTGPVRTFSRIDVPQPFAQVAAGRTAVAGVAWAQHRGLSGVEVRVDDGPWNRARLAGTPNRDTWAQWVWEWDAEPGPHTLSVRATDATGATQPQTRRPPKPDGATGWHSVAVQVS